MGRVLRPAIGADDLIVPAMKGGPRSNSFSWARFRDDLEAVGIPHKRHYEARATFITELLTGLRTGEAAARTWADWQPAFLDRLGRLIAATAHNTRFRKLKATKTRVENSNPAPEVHRAR